MQYNDSNERLQRLRRLRQQAYGEGSIGPRLLPAGTRGPNDARPAVEYKATKRSDPITVRLDDTVLAWANERAAREGRSLSNWIYWHLVQCMLKEQGA